MNWMAGAGRALIRAPQPTLIRGKRTSALTPAASRVMAMLSVISAHKKQPRRLKLCHEDLVKHQTVMAAWKIHLREKAEARTNRLKTQYLKMSEACDELEKLDPKLYQAATERQKGQRFSPEIRVPTATPPRVPWETDWKPMAAKK